VGVPQPGPEGVRLDPGRDRVLTAAGPPSLRALVLALFAGHLVFSLAPALGRIDTDFGNYLAPARLVAEGRDASRLYERATVQAAAERIGLGRMVSFVPHPPPNALLLVPLSGLSPVAAKTAWTLLLAAAHVAAFLALRGALAIDGWLLALVFLLPTAALRNALAYGQPYPILVLCVCLALRGAARGRGVALGAWLAPLLALKLYGGPFALRFLAERRWRSLGAMLVASAALAAISLLALGTPVHVAYLREVLPRALVGEVQDPYSTTWGSVSSLAWRLLRGEPDLNPSPIADLPWLGAFLAGGLPALGVLAGALARGESAASRADATLGPSLVLLALLAASPLTATYHFLLLVPPVAVLLARAGGWVEQALLLGGLAFATSAAPHYFARFAEGAWVPLAYPRLAVVVAMLSHALRGRLSAGRWLAAAGGGVVAGLLSAHGSATAEPAWARLAEARGYLSGAPTPCAGKLAWLTVDADRYAVRAEGETLWRGTAARAPRCTAGRLVPQDDPILLDRDADAEGVVQADDSGLAARGSEGVVVWLHRGRARWPRLSPDGTRVAFQAFERGSWDVHVVDRRSGASFPVAASPANEIEPAWRSDDEVLFASDRRRGLGSTAIYGVRVPR
jgi:hypothetical protein